MTDEVEVMERIVRGKLENAIHEIAAHGCAPLSKVAPLLKLTEVYMALCEV